MIYNLDDFAETYRDKNLRQVIVDDGYRHWIDISCLKSECEKYGIAPQITYGKINRWLGEHIAEAILDIDDKESVEENPVLYQLYKMYKEKYGEDVRLGIESRWQVMPPNAKVADTFEDMIVLIREHYEYIKGKKESERQIKSERDDIEKRKQAVKFKSDPDYYLVKPNEKIF